jgi:hypothetical protein
MSAEVLDFRPAAAGRVRQTALSQEPDGEAEMRPPIPTELLYRIFASDDDCLHSLAMEAFLLECD